MLSLTDVQFHAYHQPHAWLLKTQLSEAAFAVRMLLPSLLVGAGIALAVIPALIAAQRRKNIGQQIYAAGPKTHAPKQGTPTMGGLAFLVAALIGGVLQILLWSHEQPRSWPLLIPRIAPLVCLVIAAGLIGLADDLLILTRSRALGLQARWKFGLLSAVAVGYVGWTYAAMATTATPTFQEWFGIWLVLPGWATWTLGLAAIVGAANAVNLSDGLDGLAAGAALPVLAVQALVANLYGGAIVVSTVLGALIVFWFFNRHPARIFMGDTGSLALGALMAGMAFENHQLLLLPIIGIVFVVEALSVIAQVVSFKTTGRRILRMSPLHHHFELAGWPEKRVTAVFAASSFVVVIMAWLGWLATTWLAGYK